MKKSTLKSFRRSGQEAPNSAPVIDLSNTPQTSIPDQTETSQLLLANSYETKKTIDDIKDDTSNIEDQVAATELVEESVSALKTPLNTANEKLGSIYDKLSEFAERLKDNFADELAEEPLINPTPSENVGGLVLSTPQLPSDDFIGTEQPRAEQSSSIIELLRLIQKDVSVIAQNSSMDGMLKGIKFASGENSGSNKKKDDEKGILDRLAGTISKGFNKTVKQLDGISKTLFQYSLSAALNAAKFAAMIFSVVLAIDVMTVLFEKWSREISENFNAFVEKYGGFADLINTLITSTEDLRNYWVNHEYGEFILELGSVFGNVMTGLIDAFDLANSKLIAALLRKIGLDSAADTIEADAIIEYMKKGFYQPTESEKELVSKELMKRREDEESKDVPKQFEMMKVMNMSLDEAKQYYADKKRYGAADTKSTQDQMFASFDMERTLKNIGQASKKNDTSSSAQNTYIESIDKNMEKLETMRELDKVSQTDYERLTKIAQTTKMEMIHRQNEIAKLEPAPHKDKQETIRTESVEREQAKVSRPDTQDTQSSVSTNANVYNKKVTNYVQNPITSTPAPGIGGSYNR